jgi:hypothetical protein
MLQMNLHGETSTCNAFSCRYGAHIIVFPHLSNTTTDLKEMTYQFAGKNRLSSCLKRTTNQYNITGSNGFRTTSRTVFGEI